MYSDWIWVLPSAVFVWLGILTFFIWRQNNFLSSLFPKSGERDIRRKFEEVLKKVGDFKEDLDKVKNKLAEVEDAGRFHIQRVKLLRYNPYDETGGDISFTLALLNDKGDGILVTSLHARSGTRVFAKPVTDGKSSKYQLSEEEKKAIEGATEK